MALSDQITQQLAEEENGESGESAPHFMLDARHTVAANTVIMIRKSDMTASESEDLGVSLAYLLGDFRNDAQEAAREAGYPTIV